MILKHKFFILFFLLLSLLSSALNALEVTDGKMKLVLHSDIGRFSLYYLDDDKKYYPLFVVQDPRTSTLSVVVDNKIYRLGDSSVFREINEKTTGGAKFTWRSDQLEVIQEFTFIKSVTSTESDGVKVSVKFTNITGSSIDVGLRLILDTLLGEESATHFKTSANAKITKETEYLSADMPEYWVSQKEGGIGMMMLTAGYGITKADKIVFGNWKRLNDATWSYSASSTRNFNLPPYSINDSASAVYYNPRSIAGSGSVEIVFVIGKYNENSFLLTKAPVTTTTAATTTTTATTGTTNTTAASTDLSTVLSSTTNTTATTTTAPKTNSLLILSIKNDLSTLQTVIDEINKKLASDKVSEKDVELIEKILLELKTRIETYKTAK